MAYSKIYIDAMLLNWGDRLFQAPFMHARAPRRSRAQLRDDSARLRAQIKRTVKRTPEVMVKITNKASSAQGIDAVRRHLKYISRNGRVELEDQSGDRVVGVDGVRDLVQSWQFGGWGIPEKSTRREIFNVLLSMPPGTNREAVRDAAREFAAAEFGDGRAYVFAAHNDEAHPHVHLSVQVRGPDGRRLNPRKEDLRRWRERFAEQLREHGVEANATSRYIRGVTKRYPKQSVVHMLERGKVPMHWSVTPNAQRVQATWDGHVGVVPAWLEVVRMMARSPTKEDNALAAGIMEFVRTMPVREGMPSGISSLDETLNNAKKDVVERGNDDRWPDLEH